MAKQGCLGSPEKVLVGIRYSIGQIGQLIVGVVHGRVGVAVHEGHLSSGLGKVKGVGWIY